jgi:putative ATPase
MSLSPKSDSIARAIAAAREAVLEGPHGEVPPHLRSGATRGDRELGFGVGYVSPHSDPRSVAPQQYLPDGLEQALLYSPKRVGAEDELADRLAKIDAILGKRPRSDDERH